jgi:colanic acid/amylovoran biosynthesis glycosyltransferase
MSTAQPSRKATVVHSLPFWLPLTATWLYNQIRYLPPEITSHIVCGWTEHCDRFHVQNIHSLRSSLGWKWRVELGLYRWGVRRYFAHLLPTIRQCQAAVLHSHWGDIAWRDLPAAREANVPHVATFYGKDVNYLPQVKPIWAERYRELFAHISLVLCEGPHMGKCIEKLGCPSKKIQVLHLGVEVDQIVYRPRRWNEGGPFRVLIAASFREKKGIPYAIEAIGQLQDEVNQIEITIIGDASKDQRSHPEKEKILDMLKRYRLESRTRMLGYQPHSVLFEEAYRHHLFISPSVTAVDGDTEGGAPVTIIEMAATGMPIISTTHCDIPAVVLHGKTGLLAPERDSTALSECLRWFIRHPERWQEMLEGGRKHVEDQYDVVRQVRKLRDTYLSLAG